MVKKILIGRTSHYHGRPLLQILANLKDWGLGRVVMRSKWNRLFPNEQNFMIVRDIDPWMDQEFRYGRVKVDEVYRGARYEEPRWYNAVFKADWVLVPRHEEHKYLEGFDKLPIRGKDVVTILPNEYPVPPLMDMFLKRHYKNRGVEMGDERIKIPLVYAGMNVYSMQSVNNRVAKPGETPTVKLRMKDHIPPNLLEGVQKDREDMYDPSQ